jgi:hypothetical protein
VLLGGDDAAPRDLERHPDRLAACRFEHRARDVADDADVAAASAHVLSRWVGDWVDVGAGDVEGGLVRGELGDRAERGLDDDQGMVGIERLQLVVGAYEAGGGHEGWPVGVRGLVNAFPGAEGRVVAELLRDTRQQLFVCCR